MVDFGGKAKAEARGIVDLIAIRKDHLHDGPSLKRGDLFAIVLIQTKGGSASRPTAEDVARLSRVVLAERQRAEKLGLSRLIGTRWQAVTPDAIFG